MVTHSSILAGKIPWTEEPGGLRPGGVAKSDTNVSEQKQLQKRASQVVRVVKNPSANVGDVRDMDSIPGWGRSPGGGQGNPF